MSAPASIRLYYRPLPRAVIAGSAVAVIFVGLLALVGWSMDLLMLQALIPGAHPMPYFTALGFVLAGTGLLGVFRGNRLVPLLCGATLAIGFGYLLAEYSLWAGLERPPLLADLPFPKHFTEIGAQSAVVNLGLCIAGVVLMRLPFISNSRPGLRELDMLTGFLFGVASAGIVAYRAAETGESDWVWMFSMPISVAVCFMLIAVAFNAASTDTDVRSYKRSELRLPVIITVLLISISLVAWLILVLSGVNSLGSSLLVVGLLVSIPLASQTLEVWIRRLLLPEPVNTEGTFRALLGSMAEGVLVCNRKGQVTLCNPAMRSFFGLPPLEQRGLGELEHAWDPKYRLMQTDGHSIIDWNASPLKQALDGTRPAAIEVIAGGETPSYLRVTARPVLGENGKVLGAVMTAADITDIKQGEESLRQYSEVLARTSQELERVTHVSAHHLQEPVREITSYAQLLMRECEERLSGSAREYLDYISNGALRLKAQLNDLMTYLDVGSRRAIDQPVSMSDLFAKCRKEYCGQGRRSLESDGSLPSVVGDRALLGLLLKHLVGNAYKFNRSERPRVAVSARRVANFWEFRVTDNGIGIPAEHGERIFDLFHRLHVHEEFPGTGLGLAICRKIVSLHGGRIWHEAAPDGGSCFCFQLPLVPHMVNPGSAS